MKLDNIITYSMGNLLYCEYLLGFINKEKELNKFNELLDKNMNNAAKLGYISNIFLAIKESLVEKKEEGFEAKVLNSILENNANLIATKTEKGYIINNYIFKDSITLVSELRNRLAHGNFNLDLKHNRIILKINNNDIIIGIKELTNYVISSLKTYIGDTYKDEYTKTITYNDKIDKNRKKPINNKKEIINIINNTKRIEINLKRKNGEKIPTEIVEIINKISELDNKTNTIKLLYNCSKMLGNDYELTWNIKKINEVDGLSIDNFASYLEKEMNNKDYYSSVKKILYNLSYLSDNRHKTVETISQNLLNIMILETIYNNNSLDYNLIIKKVQEKTNNNFTINNNILATSALALFTSLFSYANDDIYTNNNKYTLLECNGLDYSKLDLSLIKVSKNNIDIGNINDLITKKNAKQKEIINIKEKITQNINNLEIVRKNNNTKAINNINNNLSKLYVLLSKNTISYNKIANQIKIWNNYYNNNKLYLEKESIINGIRNSISHGHYEIKTLENKIIFKNTYENNITFVAEIEINNLIKLLKNNYEIAYNFINTLRKKNITKTLHI